MKRPTMDDVRKAAGEGDQLASDNKPTQASRLRKTFESNGGLLFHDDEQRSYATIPIDSHRETWSIRRKSFKHWLIHQFYLREKKVPGSQAVQDALNLLEGKALFEGKQEEVFVRLGGTEQDVFIDLGDDEWKMIHLTAAGWSVVPHGNVRFKRGAGMNPLPNPIAGGRLET